MQWCHRLLGLCVIVLALVVACSPPANPTDGDADGDVDRPVDADGDDVVEDADPDSTPDGDADSDSDADVVEDADMDGDVEADADPDVFVPAETCEACEVHEDCHPGSFCVSMTEGGLACVPGCVPDMPECPRAFHCVIDVGRGIDLPVCLPIGATCCVDEDADDYGQGVGCLGEDCDDEDPIRNPGMSELCDGVDNDCDEVVDNPPTDCVSGRCYDEGDATYEAIEGATCEDAECIAGISTDCLLYTCEDGGEEGERCAELCNPVDADDDLFCIEPAHCDLGVCEGDYPNGDACDEDSDCISSHCDNGFCCDEGTCCGEVADCPGGGDSVRICEEPSRCQGSRGETECTDFQCLVTEGIPDDAACDEDTLALECGLYESVYCSGDEEQDPPECAGTCTSDDDCVDAAHCEYGHCVPDRPISGPCTRIGECQEGLHCVDEVCCSSACAGTCEACDLPATRGTCTFVPARADVDGECVGFSCADYFTGFGGGDDVCFFRQDVDDETATCNGAGECIVSEILCPLQPRGPEQIDCDGDCQAPVPGTCSGMTAGDCDDLDNPDDMLTCGIGECERSVQRCIGGRENVCEAGRPRAEVCNALDDDCNGTPDNGAAADLCPGVAEVSTYLCNAAGECEIRACARDHFDVNGEYDDGCECAEDLYRSNHACGGSYDLGSISRGGSRDVSGRIIPELGEDQDWFSVTFTPDGRPGGGTPRIRLDAASSANFVLQLLNGGCGGGHFSCRSEGTVSNSVSDFEFTDNQATAGPNQWNHNPLPWPNRVYFRVTRSPLAPPIRDCEDTAYRVSITR